VNGQVARVGQIARYGVADEVAGALVPVGEGRFQVADRGADVARALLKGDPPPTVGAFLFESAESAVEKEEAGSIWDVVVDGGVVGLVIIGLGCLAVVLGALRVVFLFRAGGGRRLVAEVLSKVEAGDPVGALGLVRDGHGSIPRVLSAMLHHERPTDLESVTEEALLRETARVSVFNTAIMVIAAVSPLLGLLGTVTGMIATFEVITTHGTGDPRMLSGGISAALVTTQLGLVVAIPSLLVGNLLAAWGDKILTVAETSALALRNRVVTDDGQGDDGVPVELPRLHRVAHG